MDDALFNPLSDYLDNYLAQSRNVMCVVVLVAAAAMHIQISRQFRDELAEHSAYQITKRGETNIRVCQTHFVSNCPKCQNARTVQSESRIRYGPTPGDFERVNSGNATESLPSKGMPSHCGFRITDESQNRLSSGHIDRPYLNLSSIIAQLFFDHDRLAF
jgi:hypothetical protein